MTTFRQLIRRVLPRSVRTGLKRVLMYVAGPEASPGVSSTPLGGERDAPVASTVTAADTSQAGEVAELDLLIADDFPKTLVDIGAFDGVTISNSRPYTLRGWRAILVEPHPGLYAKLATANEGMDGTTCVNMACSDRPGTLPLFFGTDGPHSAMSTLCTDDNPWFQANRAADFVDVEVTTLTDLLASHRWPHDFAMLLIDAEGMDYEVLQGLDFNRFRPRIVVTEEYISNPEKHRNKYRLLLDRDYTFYKMVGCNTFWIANEWVDACLGLSARRQDTASVS